MTFAWFFAAAGTAARGVAALLALLAMACFFLRPAPCRLMRGLEIAAWALLTLSTFVACVDSWEFVSVWVGNHPYEKWALIRGRIADPLVLGPYFRVAPAPYWWAYWLCIASALCPQFFWIPFFRRTPLLALLVALGFFSPVLFER